MGFRKLLFPIMLAVVWVALMAMAMVDFASFSATTAPQVPVVQTQQPLHSAARRPVRLLARN